MSPTRVSRWSPRTPATRSSPSIRGILDLDDAGALDPARVGAKAAALAAGRRVGLPVLPGFVVEASVSMAHLRFGVDALPIKGSGAARLAVMARPAPGRARLKTAAAGLSDSLVARSSSPLEGDGQWAGAFSSYVGIRADELPRAVVGCWASAFSVDALARHEASGVEPGTVGMPVLVQPAIEPSVAGVAERNYDGADVVHVVAGGPAPLLRGWVRGETARFLPDQGWVGDAAIALVGLEILEKLRSSLEIAEKRLGSNRLEWGVDGDVWLLQLGSVQSARAVPERRRPSTPAELVPIARALMAAPGTLGLELVLPWALAGLPSLPDPPTPGAEDLLERAVALSGELAAQVWGRPREQAVTAAAALLDDLRGVDRLSGLEVLASLEQPDPGDAAEVFAAVSAVGARLVTDGVLRDARLVWHFTVAELRSALAGHRRLRHGRVGVRPWEPLVAAVVLDHGRVFQGAPAAAGRGAGVRHRAGSEETPPPRSAITAEWALPNLSQLLWDTAALVTQAGSPAAHVFEAARSLGVPAVCGVDLETEDAVIVAVDGQTGLVGVLPQLLPPTQGSGHR